MLSERVLTPPAQTLQKKSPYQSCLRLAAGETRHPLCDNCSRAAMELGAPKALAAALMRMATLELHDRSAMDWGQLSLSQQTRRRELRAFHLGIRL